MNTCMISLQAVQRIAVLSCVIVVSVFNTKTNIYFSSITGLCAACLVFIITMQLEKKSVRPRLIRRICLLYCNQTIRNLFISNDNSATSVFSNVLLAVSMAVILMVVCDDGSDAKIEMKKMLDSLLYLYGDILDFMFDYGVFKVTIFSLGSSLFLTSVTPPKLQVSLFLWDMAKIISTNLLSQGVSIIIISVPQLEFIEAIASAVFLRRLLPSMQDYVIYLAAQRLLFLAPNMSSFFFCAMIFTEILPPGSKSWVGEMCAIYIITDVTSRIADINVWGVLIILIISHYIEYIITVPK
jgi:hypothetical protein